MKNYSLDRLIKSRHKLISGAAHTYSKGDDQFPTNAPKFILRGKGAYVWGSENKKYIDWCMGLRTGLLGHCNKEVNDAVRKQINSGTNFGRPHPVEFELADLLIKILPNTQMVKFAKNGSTVTTAATKLARAYTGRKYIALCSSQPFFSYDDWFIGTTPCNSGIPEEIKKLSLTFRYNDIESLEKLFKAHPKDIACVIMEAATTEPPQDNYLHKVQALTHKYGAIFILDEMITGFRWGLKGAQGYFNLKPDLTTYGKGIGNGYSVAVLAGRRDIMDLGGIYHKKEKVFLISTTHGAETTSLAASLAAIKFMQEKKVSDCLWKMGSKLKKGLLSKINKYNLERYIKVLGYEPNLCLDFKDDTGSSSFILKTIFLERVTRLGMLFQGYFAISYSHGVREVEKTIKICEEAFKIYKKAVDSKNYSQYLEGEPVKPVFRKYN